MISIFASVGKYPFENRLPLICSIPYTKCFWRSDIFYVPYWQKKEIWTTFEEDISRRLHVSGIHPNLRKFLIRLAKIVDGLEHTLNTNTVLRDEIGLGAQLPGDGYPSSNKTVVDFFYPFMCSIILDRSLWIIGNGGDRPLIQWSRTEYKDTISVDDDTSKKMNRLVQNFKVSFGSRGTVTLPETEDPSTSFSAHLCIQSAVLKGDAEWNRVMSNVYFVASIFWLLSLVNIINPSNIFHHFAHIKLTYYFKE